MSIFLIGFIVLIIFCVLLYFYSRTALPLVTDISFRNFQRSYLIVYLLAAAGDWLQGPYVYALYQSYGMATHDIELLFVAGFGSSMLFGTVVGSVADKYGRKANCILYGILYSLSCVTKHFNNFSILMVGRLLGGIATSILYSAFESWVILEHHKRGFEPHLLGSIFSHAVVGNSIVAICSGVVAQKAADFFGYVAPFDVSIISLVIMCVVIYFTWVENYGDQSASTMQSFNQSLKTIRADTKILCLGLIQSLFEGAMYTFVLEWTPALSPPPPSSSSSPTSSSSPSSSDDDGASIPHGIIFAGFMVSIMIGSSLFELIRKSRPIESFMRVVMLISSASLLTPVLFPGNQALIFSGFLIFEVCVGIFWPSMSTMRDLYVPEATRATTMNIFRVPLNLIVILILTQNFPMKIIFILCVCFLFVAFLCQWWLFRLSLSANPSRNVSNQEKPPLPDEGNVGGVSDDDVMNTKQAIDAMDQ